MLCSEKGGEAMSCYATTRWISCNRRFPRTGRCSNKGSKDCPCIFAQINQRDGFFLAGRRPAPEFHWNNLAGKTLLADHGRQPLVMLKFAVQYNGVDWRRIKVMDVGTPDQMLAAFRSGAADYLYAQSPVGTGEIIALVGASMPPVAFSSLCCARAYQSTAGYRVFRKAYQRSRIGFGPRLVRK